MKKILLLAISLVIGTSQSFASGDGPSNSDSVSQACCEEAVNKFLNKQDKLIKQLYVDQYVYKAKLEDPKLTTYEKYELYTIILENSREVELLTQKRNAFLVNCGNVK